MTAAIHLSTLSCSWRRLCLSFFVPFVTFCSTCEMAVGEPVRLAPSPTTYMIEIMVPMIVSTMATGTQTINNERIPMPNMSRKGKATGWLSANRA